MNQSTHTGISLLCGALCIGLGCGSDGSDGAEGAVTTGAGPDSSSMEGGTSSSGSDRGGDTSAASTFGEDEGAADESGTGAPGDDGSGSDTAVDSDSDTGPPPEGQLLSENFDGRSDWISTPMSTCSNAGNGCQDDVPAPWDLMYLDQPSVADVGPTCEISAQGAIGGSGKGVRFVDDARGRNNAWKADCQLMKYLGDVHPDLYFRFDILWNPDMTMDDYNAAKIFRAGYYLPGYFDGSASGGVFSTSDTTRGMVFIDLQRGGSAPDYEAKFKAVYRCNPGYKTDCRGTSDQVIGPWGSTVGDGQPHTVVFRMKINTEYDADGVFQAWWDGELIVDEQEVQWTTADTNLGGFNSFSIGGNQDHNWGCGPSFDDNTMCEDESQEWKHNIDNVKVGTSWESVQ